MKRFLRTLTLVLVLVFAMSSVAFSAFSAEFKDYYETPEFFFGDTDFDGRITVKDATALQKHIAKLITLSEDALYFGDVNGSGDVTISDATTIQKYVANMIDIFPVEDVFSEYECNADGTVIDIELTADNAAQIIVTVEEEGFYDITATTSGESTLYFELSSEDMQSFWLGESDGETSYIFAKLEPGVYYGYMYITDGVDTIVQFKASPSESEPPFDIEKAVELNIGDKVEVKAGSTPLVYKVNINNLETEGDELCIYTEGDDPRVTLMCYDELYGFNSEGIAYVDSNAMLFVYNDYVNNWYYVVVTQEESGSDFTLCCDTAFGIVKNEAKDIELGTADEIVVEAYTEEFEGEAYTMYAAESVYKFTPDESGYYSLNFESDKAMSIIAVIADLNSVEEGFYYIDYTMEGGKLADVEYLEAGTDYYIIAIVELYEEGSVSFSVNTSTKEEYDKAHEDDFIDDSTPDETEYTEIFVGDSITVELDGVEEFYKNFAFTAAEDTTVVIYSENSVDAFIETYDEEGWSYHYSDDIYVADSLDFAVIGVVSAGETVYFCVGTNSETGDSFTLNIVNEADYTPIA